MMDWKTAEPDDIVCYCMNVDKGAIVRAIQSGATSVTAIERGTGAGSGCSGCRSNIEQIIAIYTAPITPEPRAPGTGCCS